MDRLQFLRMLDQEGYPEPVEVSREAHGHLDLHTHPFEVKALVTQGSIQLFIDGEAHNFERGEVFHLNLEQPHAETYGPQGVQYLASRKQIITKSGTL